MRVLDFPALVGAADLLFITLDTLRFDVAEAALKAGRLPHLRALLGEPGWQHRQTPATFTYAAHHAFFAGFLPTPSHPGVHPRLFAARFSGSESTDEGTYVFEQADLPSALAAEGYKTLCVGGVGFFNKETQLSCVLPNLFQESYWSPELGVTAKGSPARQVETAVSAVSRHPDSRVFLFLNVSALHQPNCIFTAGASEDTPETMMNALVEVDTHLGRLFGELGRRGEWGVVISSDHGTAYGEDGYVGHRNTHPVVTTVPYGEGLLSEYQRRMGKL